MNFLVSLPLIAVLLNLLLVFFVLRKDIKSRLNRVFAFLLLGLGLWSLMVFGVWVNSNNESVVLWMKTATIVVPVTAALYLNFTLLYTGAAIRRWQLIALYSWCVVFIPLAFTSLIVSGPIDSSFGWGPKWGPLVPLFVLTVASFITYGFITMVRFVRKKNRLRSEKIGAGLIIDSTLLLLIGSIIGFARSLGATVFPISVFCNAIFSIVATAIVLKMHVLDRKIILRRSLIYVFLLSLTVAVYFAIIYIVQLLFPPSDLYMALNFTVLLATAMALSPAYSGIEELVDRWFYHERYDKLKALEKFSLQTYKIDNLDELSATLVRLISEALQTPDVYLLLASGSGDFITVASTRNKEHLLNIRNESPLASWLKANRVPLSMDKILNLPQLQGISEQDLQDIEAINAELMVPVVTPQNEIAGLIVLGLKTSRETYSKEDERMAQLVASNTATQLENARIYRLEKTIREEIQQQDIQKTAFLHTVAHELKTPLTAIISSSELLTDEEPVPDKIRERLVNNIRQSAESMDKRVSELLDLARTEIGVLHIQPEPMFINDLIAEVVSQLIPVFISKQQYLKSFIPGNLPRINADRERLKQVLYNLLANSNKFAPPETEITIRASNGDNKVIVTVTDEGNIIPEDERIHLFEPYFRGFNRKKNNLYPGMGLGLSISKKIIELQQGQIWYDSDQAHNRNIFSFSLPVFTG
jgi:K+-sensing histidine kinase KdpD